MAISRGDPSRPAFGQALRAASKLPASVANPARSARAAYAGMTAAPMSRT
ncbi:hypothetical protein [Actinoplanes sp. NPDC048796]